MLKFVRKGESKKGRSFAYYLCDCGVEKLIRVGDVNSGATRSCGCLHMAIRRTATRTHGLSNSKEYQSWKGMIQRCTNPNSDAYPSYGGRGISVCNRWRKFENFFEDMGFAPTKSHEVDRVDNDSNYMPSNCRWVTKKQNGRNKRNNVNIFWNGRTMCRSEWIEEMGISPNTVAWRLKNGWSEVEALGLQSRNKEGINA